MFPFSKILQTYSYFIFQNVTKPQGFAGCQSVEEYRISARLKYKVVNESTSFCQKKVFFGPVLKLFNFFKIPESTLS